MPTERTDSSCQAGPVSQNQIRQCEHDIEFGSLLFEPSVLCFSETQLFLDDTEYVLYFRADRGLCVFCFLYIPLALQEVTKSSGVLTEFYK